MSSARWMNPAPPTPHQGHDYPADVMAMLTDPVQLCMQLGLV